MIREEEVSGRKIYVTVHGLAATSASQRLWTPPTNDPRALYKVKGASARWGTASTSGLLQVEVAGAGVALGSGVNQLDAALDTSKTADTNVQSLNTKAQKAFGNDSSVNLVVSGTMTNLVDATLVIEIEKVR